MTMSAPTTTYPIIIQCISYITYHILQTTHNTSYITHYMLHIIYFISYIIYTALSKVEIIVSAPTTTWLGLGWRPVEATKACQVTCDEILVSELLKKFTDIMKIE